MKKRGKSVRFHEDEEERSSGSLEWEHGLVNGHHQPSFRPLSASLKAKLSPLPLHNRSTGYIPIEDDQEMDIEVSGAIISVLETWENECFSTLRSIQMAILSTQRRRATHLIPNFEQKTHSYLMEERKCVLRILLEVGYDKSCQSLEDVDWDTILRRGGSGGFHFDFPSSLLQRSPHELLQIAKQIQSDIEEENWENEEKEWDDEWDFNTPKMMKGEIIESNKEEEEEEEELKFDYDEKNEAILTLRRNNERRIKKNSSNQLRSRSFSSSVDVYPSSINAPSPTLPSLHTYSSQSHYQKKAPPPSNVTDMLKKYPIKKGSSVFTPNTDFLDMISMKNPTRPKSVLK